MEKTVELLSRPMVQNLRFWNSIQFFLITIGISYPVARIVLPGAVRPAMLLPLLLALLWFAWRFLQPRSTIQSPLALPLLLTSVTLSMSSFLAVADDGVVVATLFHWVSVAVLLFLTIDLLASGWQPERFVQATLLMSSVVLLLGTGALLEWWGEWLVLWRPGDQLFPISFRKPMADILPNHMAMLLNIGIPLVIAAMWRAETWLRRAFWGLWLLLATVVLFYIGSRGGWIGTVGAVSTILLPLLWSAFQARRWRRLWTTLTLAACYTGLFATLLLISLQDVAAQRVRQPPPPPGTITPVQQISTGLTTTTGRDVFWNYARAFFYAHPIFGVGPEGFATLYAAQESHSRVFRSPHAHSIYLGVLSEGGLAGVASLLLLAGVALWVAWRGWRSAAPLIGADAQVSQPGQLLILSCAAVGAGMLSHGLVEIPPTGFTGIVLYLLAVGLVPANAWTHRGTENKRYILRVLPQGIIVLLALLAWGISGAVLLERNQLEAMQTAAQSALQQGNTTRALALYDDLLAHAPWYDPAYSGRAIALAWQALDDPPALPLALAAQELAMHQDPGNQSAPVNRAALLLELGRSTEAEQALHMFAERDRSRWVAPYLLLARAAEQMGDLPTARAYWQQVLNRQPDLAESVACHKSAICPAIPLPWSSYAALVEARQLAEAPVPTELQRIWDLATAWQSTDIWSVGAQAAQRANAPQWEERFLTAALDQSELFQQQPTMHLAIVLLRNAMVRGDHEALRSLVQNWIPLPDTQVIPQITRLFVSSTEVQLAQTLDEAATQLHDPALLDAAQSYLKRVELAWQTK